MLDRLQGVYTVRDIMTPGDQLRRADRREDAEHLLHEFDVVPHPRQGSITGFFRRLSSELQQLSHEHLVSDSTNLLDMPRLFQQSQFYFVISGSRIVGYLHYSDLNKPEAKIPYFALFQAVERHLWQSINNRISEALLLQLFPDKQVSNWLKVRQKLLEKNADLGWAGIFTFPDILRIGRRCGLTDATDGDIRLLKEVRNSVAHSDRNLVESYESVQKLVEAHDLFRRILGMPT